MDGRVDATLRGAASTHTLPALPGADSSVWSDDLVFDDVLGEGGMGVRALIDVASKQLLMAEEGDSDALRVARFGFETALDQWPESPGARTGLDRVHLQAVRQSLARNDVGSAERDWRAIGTKNRALEHGLGQQVADARAAWDALQSRMVNLDSRVLRDGRIRMFAVWTLGISLFSVVQWPDVGGLGSGGLALLAVLVMTPTLLALVWQREAVMRTDFNLRIALVLLMGTGALMLNRIGGWWLDSDIGAVLAVDMLFMAYSSFVAGLYIRAAMRSWGVIWLFAAVLSFAIPEFSPYVFTASCVMCAGALRRFDWDHWDNLA